MRKTKKIIGLSAALLVMFSGAVAMGEGYTVIKEPWLDADMGVTSGGYNEYEGPSYLFPSVFKNGESVMYENAYKIPGYEVEYYCKSAYKINTNGETITDKKKSSDFSLICEDIFWGVEIPDFENTYWYDVSKDMRFVINQTFWNEGDIETKEQNSEIYSNFENPDEVGPYFYDEWGEDLYSSKDTRTYYNGVTSATKDGKMGVIDINDNIIVPFEYDMILPVANEEGFTWVLKNGKWGIIKINAENDESVKIVEQPIISLAPGSYTGSIKIEISAVEGAKIFYTIDGTVPTDKSPIYTDPLTIDKTTVLKAVAFKDNLYSEVVSNQYNIIEEKETQEINHNNTNFLYTVNFESNGGSQLDYIVAKKYSTVIMPQNPTKQGHKFDGWHIDKELSEKFDFNSKITESITLYAKWSEIADVEIALSVGNKAVNINGKVVENDVAPQIINNVTLLPIRVIAESLGAKVEWNSETQNVRILLDETEIIIVIGKDKAYVNSDEIILDSVAFIANNRTYLPLRFVMENLGADVQWNGETQTILIKK